MINFKVVSIRQTNKQTKKKVYLFTYLIDTTLILIVKGLPGEWKEHESLKERDMNVME